MTTACTPSDGTSLTLFETWPLMSIPISASASTASGLSREGCEPADEIFTVGGARARAMPSAIWLRAELATHRKRTCLGCAARIIVLETSRWMG